MINYWISKYRIITQTYNNGDQVFIPQYREILFYYDISHVELSTHEQALEAINQHRNRIIPGTSTHYY